MVAPELGVDGHALEPLLVVLVHLQPRRDGVQAGAGIVHPHLALPRRVQHAPVGQDGECHRLAGMVVEGYLLVRGVDSRAAATLLNASGPADAAE